MAFGGRDRRLGCRQIGDDRFVVMAGLGLDAATVGDASPRLDKTLGRPAYALSCLRHLLDPLLRLTSRLDGVGATLLRRSTRPDPRLERHRFRHLELRIRQAAPVELDGDSPHSWSALTVSVEPGALPLRVP